MNCVKGVSLRLLWDGTGGGATVRRGARWGDVPLGIPVLRPATFDPLTPHSLTHSLTHSPTHSLSLSGVMVLLRAGTGRRPTRSRPGWPHRGTQAYREYVSSIGRALAPRPVGRPPTCRPTCPFALCPSPNRTAGGAGIVPSHCHLTPLSCSRGTDWGGGLPP